MGNTILIQGQNLVDIAIQQYGTLEAVMQLAIANELSITDDLPPGFVLTIPDYANANTEIADYYNKKTIRPATAISNSVENMIENTNPCNYCKCFT